MISRLVIERRATRIVVSLRHGAGADLVVAAYAQVSAEFGADAEKRVAELVLRKLSQELPRRRNRQSKRAKAR
jgi:hypothetical protein